MNNKTVLAALAMDLKRVAIGYYRGSETTAERFLEEALKRSEEVDITQVKPGVVRVLGEIKKLKKQEDKSKAAEDALLYSTIIQNAALSKNL